MILRIVNNVLTVLYEQTGFSLLVAILFMYLVMYAQEHGWKNSLRAWWSKFVLEQSFRRMFLFAFYVAMFLFRTLLNREIWSNPLIDVMGGWLLWNEKGELTTEAIENVLLFIPIIYLLYANFHNKLFSEKKSLRFIVLKSIAISFGISSSIEFCQLFFRLGTFQFADVFYNTLGGCVGGIIYWIAKKVSVYKKR